MLEFLESESSIRYIHSPKPALVVFVSDAVLFFLKQV